MADSTGTGTGLGGIFSSVKNIAQSLSTLITTYLSTEGSIGRYGISAATVVKTTGGRVCRVSVTTAGSAAGTIYDANATGATTMPVFTIPNTVGVYDVRLPTNSGIVVAPGTGQVVGLGYS